MKKSALLLFILFLSITAQAGKIRMALGYNFFYAPTSGNYIEIDIKILSNSIAYRQVNGKYQGEVEIQVLIKKSDSAAVSEKYRIKSYPVGDSVFEDFYSIKKFALNSGDYLLEIYALDVNQPQDTIRYSKKIHVPKITEDIQFSDIELLEFVQKSTKTNIFTKSGVDMVPRILNYYNDKANKLIAYTELYNTHLLGDTMKYYVKYYIAKHGDNKPVEKMVSGKRIDPNKVTPLIILFDIAQLKTGQYDLVTELYNADAILMRSKRTYFDRYNIETKILNATSSQQKIIINPLFRNDMNSDSIFYFLMSLTPMSSNAEQEKIIDIVKEKDTAYAQKYFQAYWVKTSPENTTEAWLKYKGIIQTVENNYGSSIKPGFATDRGNIFIKYGLPNTIISRPNNPNQYPYEIWQYYKISSRNNVRFVFYNPTVVGNDYVLLHSDLPGLRFNNNWKNLLYIQKGGVRTNDGHLNDMNILNSRTNY